jgi:hypothetical protein
MLKVGGIYTTRSGEVARIIEELDALVYIYKVKYGSDSYTVSREGLEYYWTQGPRDLVTMFVVAGKHYKTAAGARAICSMLHKDCAIMVTNTTAFVVDRFSGVSDNTCNNIVSKWELTVLWDRIPPCFTTLAVYKVHGMLHGAIDSEVMQPEWLDHFAPGWRDHCGTVCIREA